MKEEDKTYYEVLSKAYHESSVQFDKQILFISSGAFGLSFTFIKGIVKLDKAEYQWVLNLVVQLINKSTNQVQSYN